MRSPTLSRSSLFIITLLLCLTTAASAEPVRIDNGAEPAEGVQELELQEKWRAGGEDDEIFFGNIQKVLSGPNGNVYLMDSQLHSIFVYTPDGQYVRTIGAQGEGPGEVSNINDILFLPDGTLGMVQAFPGKIVKLHLNGDPAGVVQPIAEGGDSTDWMLVLNGRYRGDTILLAGMRWQPTQPAGMAQRMYLSRFDEAGAEQHTFLTKQYDLDFSDFVWEEARFDFVWDRFDAAPDGSVCFAPQRNAYEIHVCDPGGETRRIITRRYEHFQRDDELRRQAEMTGEAVGSNYGVPVQGVKIEGTEPDISHLQTQPDGTLWVRTGRGDHDPEAGILTGYDVFDADGTYRRRVRLVAPGDADMDSITLLPDGSIIVVQGAADAYRRAQGTATDEAAGGEEIQMEVICYSGADVVIPGTPGKPVR